MLIDPKLNAAFLRLLTDQTLEEFEEGLHVIVEFHGNYLFRAWAAECIRVVRVLREMERQAPSGN